MRKKFLPSSMSHWHNLWGQSFIAFRFCRNSSNLFEIVDNACLQKDLSFLDFCHCYKTTKEISICETAKIMTVIPRVNTILFNLYVLCEITNGRENEQRKKKCKPEIYDSLFHLLCFLLLLHKIFSISDCRIKKM